LCKFNERVSQIACSGRSVADGFWLARRLAWPVLGYTAQVYPAPRRAAFISQLAVQRLAHLPHHGVPPALLRSLPTVGDLELLPLDVFISASRALASARLAPLASAMLMRLRSEVSISVLRPLCSLGPSGGVCPNFLFQPLGWDGAALAAHVDAARVILDCALASFAQRGRIQTGLAPRRNGRTISTAEVARSLEPCLSSAALGALLCRRVKLWLPERLVPRELAILATGFVAILASSPAPARWAALKFLCNSWTLGHRFSGVAPPCPACGAPSGERLQHLVLCRAFWAPLLASRPELRSATFASLALAEHSPGSLRLAYAALAEPSAAAWPLRVRAARP
jgi:hypothetical protein